MQLKIVNVVKVCLAAVKKEVGLVHVQNQY